MKRFEQRAWRIPLTPWVAAFLFFACVPWGVVCGVEIHSNGRGGGMWSVSGTWHGGMIPSASDSVAIAADDTVVFDGHSPETATCRQIQIDPHGILMFKSDDHPHTLTVSGPIESYGTLRMDGSKTPSGIMQLRLVGDTSPDRTIRLKPNSRFYLSGVEGDSGRENVRICAGIMSTNQSLGKALISASGDVMIDIQGAEFRDVALEFSKLDNTGFKSQERLTIMGNFFNGQSSVTLSSCDTPTVQRNIFLYNVEKPLGDTALRLTGCKLAQINKNTFQGRYEYAIRVLQDTDSSLGGNIISNAIRGIGLSGQNAMVRGNRLMECVTGMVMESSIGVVEDMLIDGAIRALELHGSSLQFTDVRVDHMPSNGVALFLDSAWTTLLNCNIDAEAIRVSGQLPAGGVWVQTMNFLVVKVKGTRPAHSRVEVRTASASGGPPKGSVTDLNVRNSPARVGVEGTTPVPRSLRAIIVRSWALVGRNGKKTDAPFYDMTVSALDENGEAPKVLKSMVIEPKSTWYRPDPNAAIATVEVDLP